MCIEDIAISRRCYVKKTTVSNGVVLTLPANPDRIAVRLSCIAASPCFGVISDTATNINNGTGIKIFFVRFTGGNDTVGVAEANITYQTDGPVVQGSLSFYLSGADGWVNEVVMNSELAAYVAREAGKWNTK